MAALNRVFLGWKQPAVQSSAEFLLDRYTADGLADLTSVTIVTPTRRAGRRIREVLLQIAAERSVGLFPPKVTTVGALPELLYEKKLPFAPRLVQQFAWVDALKNTDRKTLQQILPQYPDRVDDPRWMELGALLQRQHLELTDNCLDFATVAKKGQELREQLNGFSDFARWQALATVQARYLRTLDELELWDRQTARNYAIDNNQCTIDGEVVLLGAADLTRTLRGMLGQVSSQVTSLVFAEPTWSDRFDEFGCVAPAAWQSSMISVEDRHILVADGPANQADAVVYAIEAFDGKYAAEDYTIGVPDTSLVPHLENKLRQFDIDVRWGPGRSLTASPPVQWLRIAADFLLNDRYERFAELMRHKDTELYLRGLGYSRDVVKELDRYFDSHLPDKIQLPEDKTDDVPMDTRLPDGTLFVLNLLKALRDEPRTPADWCDEIQETLSRLYDNRELNIDNEIDRYTLEACDQLSLAMDRIRLLPETLTPKVSATAAILMVISQMDDEEVAPAAHSNAIEMVGWLDLPLDDAKVAIVTNMNDGVVPRSVGSDVFLPNTFREILGLDDNARRYARDAYALESLLRSKMAVRLVMGRRASTNDPLRPSRLLLATRSEKLANRCLRLFNGKADCAPIVMPVDHDELMFHVPKPEKLTEPIQSLSVSDFANYLTCPYRFYLRKVRRLRTMDDKLTELDAATFGTLAHDVLDLFGKSEFADCGIAEEIRLYLAEHLNRLAAEQFGRRPKPTVQVQLAQLRLRLDAFAEKQAEWREYGWKIIRTELEEDHGKLVVDGKPIQLRGRIDRIDYREKDGVRQFAVLDYKTGDAGDGPRKKHLKNHRTGDPVLPGHWVDLQLPLYRYLLRSIEELGADGAGESQNVAASSQTPIEIKLGYVLLPSVASETRFDLATWNDETLEAADQAAHEVVRRIRREEFWPPTEPYPYANTDDYGAIVQHGVFGREPLVETEVGA